MNEMELPDATTLAGLPRDRFDEMEQRYNSRSYRCALHMCAMLRRPKTVRFHWQGILRELSGAEVRRFGPCLFVAILWFNHAETAHFGFRKELNYFTHLNNYN
jgi:hypothetical protein